VIFLCIVRISPLIYPQNELYSTFNRKISAYFTNSTPSGFTLTSSPVGLKCTRHQFSLYKESNIFEKQLTLRIHLKYKTYSHLIYYHHYGLLNLLESCYQVHLLSHHESESRAHVLQAPHLQFLQRG
jgi:hypothetical protein